MKKLIYTALTALLFSVPHADIFAGSGSFWAGMGLGAATTTIAHAAARPRPCRTQYVEVYHKPVQTEYVRVQKAEFDRLEAENTMLQSEIRVLKAEKEDLLEDLEREYAQNRTNQRKLKQTIKQQQSEINSLKGEMKKLCKKIDKITAQTAPKEILNKEIGVF